MDSAVTLNLQGRAMIKISECVWQNPRIQKKLYALYVDWKKFVRDDVLPQLDKLGVPANVKGEFLYVVKGMGREVFAWYEYLYNANTFESAKLDFTEKLYWTALGKIDVQRVIEENWLKNLRPEVTERVFEMCLKHGLDKDRVDRVSKAMSERYDGPFPDKISRAAAFYYAHRDTRRAEEIAKHFGLALDGNLLKLLVGAGNCESVKSLWPQLDRSTRHSIVMDAFKVAYSNSYTRYGYNFTPKRFEEIAAFLFQNMNDQQKLEVMRNRKWYILDSFMSWPWLGLLMPNLKLLWSDMVQGGPSDDDIERWNEFIRRFILEMIEEAEFGSTVLLTTLKEVEQLSEREFDVDLADIAVTRVKCWKLSELKHLLNCPLFVDQRGHMLEAIEREYVKVRSKNTDKCSDKYRDLDEFVEGVFGSIEERNAFKKKMQARSDYINMYK